MPPPQRQDRVSQLIVRVWLAVIAMNAVIIAAGWLWVHDVTGRIDSAERGVCGRVQRLRANTNRNSATLYAGIRVFASDPRQSAATQHRLLTLARVPQYLAPTDCDQAVAHPATYRAPPMTPVADLPPAKRRQLLRTGR